jgi:creatinine amidohydrolase
VAAGDRWRLGAVPVRNRVVFGPHATNLGRGRRIADRHAAYYRRRAAGGVGVVVTEEASVHPGDWPYERAPLAAACGPGWAVARACHAQGAAVLAALGHSRGQGTSPYSQEPLWAPSRVPEVATREVPKAMEDDDIEAVVAGFDGLGEHTWPEVAGGGPRLLVVPLGSTEQHGPHLPLDTDTEVAVALAGRLAAARPDTLVAPALPYGASGEHAGFAGTLSLGSDALEHVVVELVRSADAFAGVLLLSGHGGNTVALARAVARLVAEGRRVRTWSPSGRGDGRHDAHAGWTETSLMLAIRPAAVRVDRLEPGDRRPLAELMEELRSGGVAAVAANGVLGDPTGATAEEGRRLLDRWAAQLQDDVRGWP